MDRWLTVLIVIFFGLSAGLGFYTLWYAKGASYLSDDPKACANCHVMQSTFDSWAKGGHQHVATCNDCHVPKHPVKKWIVKAENGFHHSFAFTFSDVPLAIRARPVSRNITQVNCLRCHESLTSHLKWVNPSQPDSAGCLHCHSNVGHLHP